MGVGKRPRRLLVLGVIAILLCAAWTGLRFLPPHLQHRHVVRLMVEFRANPSQTTADPLIRLLVEQKVTQDEGDEILRILLFPRVRTKESYEPNEDIKISVSPMYPVKVTGLFGDPRNYLAVAGITDPNGIENCDSLDIAPELDGFVDMHRLEGVWPPLRVAEPGCYQGKVRLTYFLGESFLAPIFRSLERGIQDRSVLGAVRRFLGLSGKESSRPLVYHCEHEVPIQIRVQGSQAIPATNP